MLFSFFFLIKFLSLCFLLLEGTCWFARRSKRNEMEIKYVCDFHCLSDLFRLIDKTNKIRLLPIFESFPDVRADPKMTMISGGEESSEFILRCLVTRCGLLSVHSKVTRMLLMNAKVHFTTAALSAEHNVLLHFRVVRSKQNELRQSHQHWCEAEIEARTGIEFIILNYSKLFVNIQELLWWWGFAER